MNVCMIKRARRSGYVCVYEQAKGYHMPMGLDVEECCYWQHFFFCIAWASVVNISWHDQEDKPKGTDKPSIQVERRLHQLFALVEARCRVHEASRKPASKDSASQ